MFSALRMLTRFPARNFMCRTFVDTGSWVRHLLRRLRLMLASVKPSAVESTRSRKSLSRMSISSSKVPVRLGTTGHSPGREDWGVAKGRHSWVVLAESSQAWCFPVIQESTVYKLGWTLQETARHLVRDPSLPISVGCLYSPDWTTGLDYWTDLFSIKKHCYAL